jgi:hypothetical protein
MDSLLRIFLFPKIMRGECLITMQEFVVLDWLFDQNGIVVDVYGMVL